MTDVSVIVAAWKAEATIHAAIGSALTQDGVSLEVIVVDDSSPDRTAARVKALADPRVRLIESPRNAGPAAARNLGLASARGTWAAILDADDVMLPGRLSGMAAAARDGGFDVLTDNMWVETPDGRRRLFLPETLDGGVETLTFAAYAARNHLFARQPRHGYLKPLLRLASLRRHGIGYEETTRIGEDFLLVADLMTRGGRYGRIRSAGYVYTTGGASISRRLSARDAAAMADADRDRLASAHLSAGDRAALRAHLNSVEQGARFVAMVEDLKAMRIGAFAKRAAAGPASLRHFSMPVRARLARWRA